MVRVRAVLSAGASGSTTGAAGAPALKPTI
jgi:hypothetical protein